MTQQNAAHLFDTLIKELGLKNDAALGRLVGITPPHISKMRHGSLPVSSEVLLRIYDNTEYSIEELREMAAHQRKAA
ncbi:MAG: hypothetical protein ACXWVD_00485 [Telluria sp.]